MGSPARSRLCSGGESDLPEDSAGRPLYGEGASLMDPAVVPKNLIIRISATKVDGLAPRWWPWTSTVTSGHDATCPAPKQGNQCKSCRACWNRSVSTVSYGKH